MLIDWFTVGAQAINFLVLVWLLKRFLYKPILDAIDARERRVAEQLSGAEAKMAQAQKQHDEYLERNAAFDRERDALLAKAEEEAKAESLKIVEDARRAADALSARRRQALEDEIRNINRLIRDRATDEIFAVARKALQDLAGDSLERRVTEAFLRRLASLSQTERATLIASMQRSGGAPLVKSAFELPPDQRAAIEAAIRKEFSTGAAVRFETAPDLVAGIELAVGGLKAGWSVSDYLASMEEDLAKLQSEKTKLPAETA
jgi:F-type H+-transporting ATPase subunit b